MRVKVGDTWYEVTPEHPIMVEFTEEDKHNIINMAASANRYAIFHSESALSKIKRKSWMADGSRPYSA